MTRLDRVLKLLEEYDDLAVACIKCLDSERWQIILNELRSEKEALTQELIEHGCRRRGDRIPQDIFSEKPAMKQETWSGGW